MSAVGAVQTAGHDKTMVQAASYPPLQKAQGQGTHSFGTGMENQRIKGWATRPSKFLSASSSIAFPLFECWRTVPHQSLRNELVQIRSCWFHLLLLCTIIVAVGVAVEGVEHLLSAGQPYVDADNGVFHAAPRTSLRDKLERFGWLLVVVGVIGEGIFEGATSSADEMLQSFDNTLLAITIDRADSAARSAKTAHEEADAVEAKAEVIQQRLDKASAHLGTLETGVLAYGPRWPFLQKNAPKLIKQFAPFAGQRAELFICTNRLTDGEAMATWGNIANILGKSGAKWNLEGKPDGINVWDGGPSCQGLEIFVGPNASKGTMRAAKSLSSALENILPPSPNPLLLIVPPEVVEQGVRANPNWANAPFVVAGRETELITVFIGEHPNLGILPTNKKKSK